MVYHHHASYSTAMPYDMPDFSLKKLLCGNEKKRQVPWHLVSSEGWTASRCGLFHHDAIEPIIG
jgi:hypothetical protein